MRPMRPMRPMRAVGGGGSGDGVIRVPVNILVLEGTLEPLDDDVVAATAAPIPADRDTMIAMS